ncbi:MFS transporter [Nitratireductor sp. XY-223]|uniref:MFS transporter n=1 Tax=Nitratireductor sp. XY-223 TaxID=2561926 RepID=UPI0010AAE5B1|nr:MFS transporter [Nitratireductor sp. XY-223]
MHNLLLRQNRNYRLLFTGSALSNLGDGIAALAFPWLATMISSNPIHIAIVAFATRLPWFLLALPAGVITDRADRQRLMVGADIIRLLLSLGVVGIILGSPALPLAEESGLRLPLILALASVAFFLGTAEVFRDNTAQTVLPMIVEPKDLESANGQIWSIEQVMGSFVGPPVAGLLIALAVPAPFGFDAVMFALSAWCLWLIAFPLRKEIRARAGFLAEFKDGLRWIARHALILRLAVMLGVLNALHTMTLTILVLYAQEVLLTSAFGYGLLLTAGAAGGVLGGLVCPAIARRIGNGASLFVALSIFPLPYLVIAATSSAYLVAVALFVEMLAALLWNVVTVSYRQRTIPNALLGRVNGIYRFLGWGMMPLGALAAGLIVSGAEPGIGREAALRLPFLCASLGCGILLAYAAFRLRFPRQDAD